jgi:hypothetical protein
VSAFVTLNDPVFVECAQGLARRLLELPNTDDAGRIRAAFQILLARDACEGEMRELAALLERERATYRGFIELARQMSGVEAGVADEVAAERAAWTVLANVLLNLDEALTRN